MNWTSRRFFLRSTLVVGIFFLLTLVTLTLVSYNVELLRPQDIPLGGEPCSFEQSPFSNVPDNEDLQRQLQQLKNVIGQLEKRLRQQDGYPGGINASNGPCAANYIHKQIEQSEMLHGKRWHNEYEIVPHAFFTLNAFYPTELGLGQRVVETPIGSRRRDLQEAVNTALTTLNRLHKTNSTGNNASQPQSVAIKHFLAQDFIEGHYRIDPVEGTQYELWFQSGHLKSDSYEHRNNGSMTKVALLRPHAPLTPVHIDYGGLDVPIINIIVPLAGRLTALRSFLDRFEANVLPSENHVHLTIVFFGTSQWDEVRRELLAFEKRTAFNNFHLLNINGTFSRARGLQTGVEHWEGTPKDVLIFLCDVDVSFDARFLGRCRRQSRANRQAYFPMVFSLYNPNVTHYLNREQPSAKESKPIEKPVLAKDTGFWRNFGFGMVCAYRSDFIRLGGFHGDTSFGWGGEDVYLYRKFIRSTIRVVRAPDPALFHLWHPKKCNKELGPVQHQSCLRSRAFSEASHDQLGLLLYEKFFNESD